MKYGSPIPPLHAMSTGNDIVALHAIDRRRTVQPRFYSKILSGSEQELYSRMASSGLPFELFVWLLWSIKESAYKYEHRIEEGLIFSPLRIEVKRLEPDPHFYRGLIHSHSGNLYSRSTVNADYIATVVSGNEDFDGVWSGVASIDRTDRAGQSASVRNLLLDKLGSLRPDNNRKVLRLQKDTKGCPSVIVDEKMQGSAKEPVIPVSLAHHGHFIAYSFFLDRPGFSHPVSVS